MGCKINGNWEKEQTRKGKKRGGGGSERREQQRKDKKQTIKIEKNTQNK